MSIETKLWSVPSFVSPIVYLPVLGTLLAAQRAGGADYLVTGDKDLLAMSGSFPIVMPAQFWAMHGGL